MKYAGVFLVLAIVISATPSIVPGIDHVIDSGKNPQYLFVMSANSGTFKDGKLTLKDVPLVIYFSDRPDRIAGHMSLEQFVKIWGKGKDSFRADPPNATLSVFNEAGNKDAVLKISDIELKGDVLTYKIRTLEGSAPKSFGPSTLFIDLFAFPFPPTLGTPS